MKPRTLAGLILCNLIWSFHPTMGKLVLAEVSSSTGAWARYALTFLAYAAAAAAMGLRPADAYARPVGARDWGLFAILAFMSFCFSPLTHMLGLTGTSATDNSLIIAMEPMITVLFARVFLGEKLTWVQISAFGIALAGFCLLSGVTVDQLGGGMTPHLGSNLLILLALCGEATYSSAGRPLVERYSPLRAFGTASLLGAAFITISVFLIKGGAFVSELGQLSWKGVAGLLWLGPLGTTATYLYWMFALKEAPVASLALTIFVQPLFGALWGYWLLGDRLSVAQTLGGVLILLAVFAETARYLTRRATFPAELPPPAP